MRTFAALLMVVAVQSVSAQSAQKPHSAPASPARSTPHSRSSVSPSVPGSSPSPFAARPSTYAPNYTSPSPDRPRLYPGFSPFSLGYGYAATYSAGSSSLEGERHEASSGQQDASGTIYLDVEPRTAHVYVDGFYVGSVDDFRRTAVMLHAGRHWIDLRASGYETLTIPVNIAAGQPARFRGDLIAVRKPPAEAVPPRGPETMYVIPGCYAGNRQPRESALPQGCDVNRMHVLAGQR